MDPKVANSIFDEISPLKKMEFYQFDKETPRKMTIHILSERQKDCISLVEFLTKKVFPYSNELLERNITNKVNLYSFMNYIVYKNASEMMKAIIKKSQLAQEDKSKTIFSEMIIIIDNESIFDQIDEIRHQIDDEIYNNDNVILSSEYYIPFILIISPRRLDLKGFKKNKTFKYDIYLEDILKLNNNTSKERKDEIFKFFRKINVIFSYYNELGDEFSFTNSEGEDIIIKLEDSNSPVNMNILLLGESGAGKSTLLNLIVGEKKSLEGGNGFSTTSKKY